MKNILIKSLVMLSVICCSNVYSKTIFEAKSGSGAVISKDNKKQNDNNDKKSKANQAKQKEYAMFIRANKQVNNNGQESLLSKVRRASKNPQGVTKESYQEEKMPVTEFDEKKIKSSNIIIQNVMEMTISGYITLCGVAVKNNNFYYDGENVPGFILIKPKSDTKTKMDKDGLDFVAGEAGIKFKAGSTLNNWTKFYILIEIQAEKSDIDIDKALGALESDKFGSIMFGNFKGPDNDFVFSGQQLLLAAFGIDGIVTSQVDYATGCLTPRYPIGFSGKSTKIAYYTPIYAGFQFGCSYTPDTKHVGHDKRNRFIGDKSSGNDNLYIKGDDEKEKPCGLHNVSFGIRYDKDFGNGFKLRAGLVYITEKTQNINTNCYYGNITEESKPTQEEIKLNDARSWVASLELTYKNFTIAGGYYNSGKSRLPQASEFTKNGVKRIIPAFMVDENGDAGHAWNIGAKLRLTEKFELTGVYHNISRKLTNIEKATAQVLTFAAEYKINKNLTFFGEIDWVKSESSQHSCSLYNLNRKTKDALKKTNSVICSFGATVLF